MSNVAEGDKPALGAASPGARRQAFAWQAKA